MAGRPLSSIVLKLLSKNLKEVCEKYDLSNSNVQLVVDDGLENNGCVNDFMSVPGIQLKKSIAQVDVRQSNSMIKAANKRIKYDYLFTEQLLDFHATKTYLSSAIKSFNNKPLNVAICMHSFGSIAWNCP